MSHQATSWAIEQVTGSPSAKATLWSIANYANQKWCAWPSQELIAKESEQSVDSVRRRLVELELRGLVRRIPLKFAGRKTVDFIILKPSTFFSSELSEIEQLVPRGCSIDRAHAAASCCSADGPTLPQALPQSAADAAAMVLEQEPRIEPKKNLDGDSRSREAFALTKEIAVISGILDEMAWPPGWVTAVYRVEAFLRDGYTADDLRNGTRAAMAHKRDGPPHSIEYFRRPWAKARGQREAPVPPAEKGSSDEHHKSQPRADGNGSGKDSADAPFSWLSVPQGARS